MNSKTFKDLQKGDKIYSVFTDSPKLTIIELEITDIVHPTNFQTIFHVKNVENKERHQSIYLEDIHKESCITYCVYERWHSNYSAAINTIKETIQWRIKKKQETIREAKRALENYKKLLKEYDVIG